MRRQTSFSPPAVGGSALLVIFAVLCLTVFAILSLATAQANARLSQKSADTVSAYYAADTQAEEILARLRAGTVPEGVNVEGTRYTYIIPISDTQTLEVEVELRGTEYAVKRWQAVYTGEWTPDTDLNVWDGESVE